MSRAAADRIRLWREKPHVFVREVFGITPDAWQDDALALFPTSPRLAMKACKGPGKTSVLSWLCWNYLLTRPRPKIAAVSISAENLADGLWTEMAKWQAKAPLLRELFTWTKTRIFCREAPEEWWMSARTWPKSADANAQADTLAGLHADYLLFVIDEAGGIPDAVMAAAEAGLANTTGDNEAHIVIAGNPTHLEGPLYRACTTERSLWQVIEITSDPDDPKRTPRVSAEWARQQIQKYGRDNPWVLVNVFGKFPPSSLNALIGPDEVRAAMQRYHRPEQYDSAAMILGVDVAREGDDKSVIFARQGIAAFMPTVLRNVDSLQGAGTVSRIWTQSRADACFIDNTGGFGAGWIDQLRQLGRSPIGIHFAGKASNLQFVNKRAEMLWDACQWVKEGGALPNVPELVEEMTAHTYFFRGDAIQIEEKDQIKAKIGRSPDYFDGLALTFAHPVSPVASRTREHDRRTYSPFAHLRKR
jgi:phage terminase large subunit